MKRKYNCNRIKSRGKLESKEERRVKGEAIIYLKEKTIKKILVALSSSWILFDHFFTLSMQREVRLFKGNMGGAL